MRNKKKDKRTLLTKPASENELIEQGAVVAGYRDAAEHLQRRYTDLCNQLGCETSKEMYNTDTLCVLIKETLNNNELMIIMNSDFNQGVLVGRLLDLVGTNNA